MKTIVACATAAVVFVAGCSGPANKYDAVVTGTVTIDGELANNGTVTFHPVDGGKVAVGRVHPDGSYSLRTGQGDLHQVDGGTVVPGEYIITVTVNGPPQEDARVGEGGPLIPGPSLIAAKYATKETSDLKRTVKPGPQVFVLELERAEPPVEDAGEAAATDGEAETAAGDADAATPAAEGEQTPPAQGAPAATPEAAPPAAGNATEASSEAPQP
jgi:hypothetical protein